MIDRELARLIALENAFEDWCGFYEVIWDYNARLPEAGTAEKLEAGIASVLALLEAGLVEISFAPAWPPDAYEPVAPERAGGIIQDPASWRPPSETAHGSFYALGTTDLGNQAYLSLTPAQAHLLLPERVPAE